MKKKALIIPMGRSPAIATEMVRYLEPEGITDVVLVPTKDNFVLAGTRLVEAAMRENYPRIRVHISVSDVVDVVSGEDTIRVMTDLARAVCKEKFDYRVDHLYLSIAGGRKEITVTSTILGLAFGITAIYHVINKEVKSYNDYQEKIKSDIEWFIEPDIERRVERYREQREKLDYLLFPSGSVLEYIKVPTIPYSPGYISFLKRLLHPRGIYFEEEKVNSFTLEMLKRANLIVYNDFRAWPTDIGLQIGKMLRCEV